MPPAQVIGGNRAERDATGAPPHPGYLKAVGKILRGWGKSQRTG